ncbi:MAG: hypothetical protein CSA31_01935 [Desulfobulbus propionicus]|nr:MAG: hypothetical protein CSB34_06675 [Desulfobulbus propionicus]PIE60459.1 MAG: hypothetical protein CSA31_01935 [Desulfobulbus propionicus]
MKNTFNLALCIPPKRQTKKIHFFILISYSYLDSFKKNTQGAKGKESSIFYTSHRATTWDIKEKIKISVCYHRIIFYTHCIGFSSPGGYFLPTWFGEIRCNHII